MTLDKIFHVSCVQTRLNQAYPNVVVEVINTHNDAKKKRETWLSSKTSVQCVVQFTIFWDDPKKEWSQRKYTGRLLVLFLHIREHNGVVLMPTGGKIPAWHSAAY